MGVDEATSEFMVNAPEANMAIIQFGKIAQEKTLNQRVKNYASMMVRDHSKASDELKTLAAQKNVALPTNISEVHQRKADALNRLRGLGFDKGYMHMMEDGHKSTVRAFEKNTDNNDADIRAFVHKMLPTFIKHRDSADAIKKELR